MADFQRLIKMLQSKNPDERFEACEKLRVATEIPPEVLEALRSAASDTNRNVADAAERAIKIHSKDINSVQEEEISPIEKEEKVENINRKGVIFGILGALIGAVPVSIVKTIFLFSNSTWLCKPLGNERVFPEIQLSTCGVLFTPYRPEYWSLFCIFILLGGGVFGFLGAGIGLKRFQEKKLEFTAKKWGGLLSWSFTAGILFDLLFVFLFMWPGQ